MKRKVLIATVAVLVALIAIACQWLLARGSALAILEKETSAGLYVKWRLPSWAEEQPYLARLWPEACLVEAQADYKIQDAAKLGDALCHFGSLEKLSIGQGDPDAINTLFKHMREHPRLTSLFIFNVEIDERIIPALARWQSIQSLAIVPSKLTGEAFPRMPELRDIDIEYSPINDSGLVQLTSCPKIKSIHIKETELSSSAILEAARAGKSHLRDLSLSVVKLLGDDNTPEGRDKLREAVRQIAPELKLYIDD